jgi:hypothetical protein
MQRERAALIDDAHDDAGRPTAARAAGQQPGLWHDLARRWLGARQPERQAAWNDTAAVPALGVALA